MKEFVQKGGRQLELSVIVPVYNTENFLSKWLVSIVNQKIEEIVIILVDDGSIYYSA